MFKASFIVCILVVLTVGILGAWRDYEISHSHDPYGTHTHLFESDNNNLSAQEQIDAMNSLHSFFEHIDKNGDVIPGQGIVSNPEPKPEPEMETTPELPINENVGDDDSTNGGTSDDVPQTPQVIQEKREVSQNQGNTSGGSGDGGVGSDGDTDADPEARTAAPVVSRAAQQPLQELEKSLTPPTPMPTDAEVSKPIEKPKRKSLLPIPRDPDIPEMLPQRCRLLKFQLPKIDIVRVEVFQKPRRVHVTVRHYVKKTISLHCYMLEFTDSEGKFIYRKEARSYKNNGRAWLRYKPNQYEKFGFSQSEFILTSKWIVDKYDMRKKFGVEFGLNFRIYAKNVPYYQPEEGHVLILRAPTDLDKDKMLDVVGQFPKDEDAPAAPSLIKPKMTTLWATLKK